MFEQNFDSNFSVYLNPIYGNVNIDLNNKKNVNIRITKQVGKVIFVQKDVSSSPYNLKIDDREGGDFISLMHKGKERVCNIVKK